MFDGHLGFSFYDFSVIFLNDILLFCIWTSWIFYYLILFGGTRVPPGYWGRALGQVLYHLIYTPRPFLFYFLGVRPCAFCLGLCSHTIGIIGTIHHHTHFVCWDGSLVNFLSRLALNYNSLISTSWKTGIADMIHHVWPCLYF